MIKKNYIINAITYLATAGLAACPAYAAPAAVKLTVTAKALAFDGEEFDYQLAWKGKLSKNADPDMTLAIQVFEADDPDEIVLDEDSVDASGGSAEFSATPKTKYKIKFFDDDGKVLKTLTFTSKKAPKVTATPTPRPTSTATPKPTATPTVTPTANPYPTSVGGGGSGGEFQYGGTVPNSTCAKHGDPGNQDWVGELKYKQGSSCFLHDSYGDHQISCNANYPTLPGGIIPGPYNATFNFAGAEAKCYHHHANDVCIEIGCGPPYQQIGLGENLGSPTNGPLADPYRVPISVCAKHGVPGEQDWVAIFSYTNPFDQKCYTHDWNGEHQIACKTSGKPYPQVSYGNVPGPYHATFDFETANATCIHRHADDVCIVIACGPAYQSIGVGG